MDRFLVTTGRRPVERVAWRGRAAAPAWLLAAPAVLLAHRSGLYDEDNVISIEGAITEIAWIDLHVRLILEAAAVDGDTERWEIEGASVNALERLIVGRKAVNPRESPYQGHPS